jgi:hypothetical protein
MKNLKVASGKVPSINGNGYPYGSGRASALSSNRSTPDEPEADPVSRCILAACVAYNNFLLLGQNVLDWDRHTIVGTCTDIFKDYLRLTSVRVDYPFHHCTLFDAPTSDQDPRPETIRPYAVLQVTLGELKKRWRAKAPYNWICSQFKSLRQDLTVRNEYSISPTFVFQLTPVGPEN